MMLIFYAPKNIARAETSPFSVEVVQSYARQSNGYGFRFTSIFVSYIVISKYRNRLLVELFKYGRKKIELDYDTDIGSGVLNW